MKLPLSVDGRDVIVEVASDGFAVDRLTVADVVRSTEPHAPDPDHLAIAERALPLDVPIRAAGLRPGDHVRSGPPPPQAVASPWVIQVLAGTDAGRTIALPGAPGDATATVGRAAEMTVSVASAAVSKHHCTIRVRDGVITVTDAGSLNGTVVDGTRLGAAPVTVAPGRPIRCGPVVLTVGARPAVDTPRAVAAALVSAPSGPVPYYRPPTDLPPPPPESIEPPPPPRRPRTGRPGLLGLLIPLVIAAVMVRITRQWLYGLFALMGPLMLLISSVDRAGRNRRIRRRSRRRFRQEIVEFGEEVAAAHLAEMQRRDAVHPHPAAVVQSARTAGASLWHRRRDHPLFMHLTIGRGDVAWAPPVVGGSELPDVERVIDRARILHASPLVVPAADGTVIGLAGERTSALATARGLLLQVTVLHGPAEVRVVIVTAGERAPDWEWAKWLPHLRPTFAEDRLLVVLGDALGHVDAAAIDDVLADAESGAALVVVVDTAGLADSGDAAIRRMLRRTDAAATGIIVAPSADALPDRCDVVVDHHATAGEATCRWPREGGRRQDVVIGGVDAATAELAARGLARLSDPDAGGGTAALPARLSLAALLGLRDAAATQVAARWADADRVAPVVGLGASGTVVVDLERDGPHVAVVGGRGTGKTEQLTAIVLALAAGWPPEQLHLVLWGERFGHLHRLPQVASTLNRIDEAAITTFVEGLDRELTNRERRRTAAGADGADARLVVVVDDVDTIVRVLPKAADDLVRLWRRARGLGVHMVWSTSRSTGSVTSDLVDLSAARIVLRVASTMESNELIGIDAAAKLERSLPGRAYVVAGRADPREIQGGVSSVGAPMATEALTVTSFALADGRLGGGPRHGAPDERVLTELITAAGATAARPPDLLSPAAAVNSALRSPGLLELLGAGGPDGLASITDRWLHADTDDLLRVPIGVDPDMRPVLLDLKESALAGMGPHGLLVGATGSGKSELLRTLVCGLALTHDPEVLSFVLVDFKGGASFASLGRLPHVAGVVTNLADDLALIDRILAALNGEQRRRQELLAAAGNLANVREYREARRAGRLPPEVADLALPELLLVVDEFAELLDQEPAFIEFFLTIGRVGRSLGIHLLLASQRLEEGKLRGLDTYLSYRLGLRTFSAIESRIVLGVPDAFSLPPAPGGGYLKVGSSSFERFQASYVSGPIDGAPGGPTVLDATVERLADAAPPVHQIWLPPLPACLALDSLFGEAGFVHDPDRGFAAAGWPYTGRLVAPVGLLDEPDLQRQTPMVIDLGGAQASLAIAGAPQSGKSVLVRSLVLSLAVTHTPDELQVYALDFGGGTLDSLTKLPHVGAVASRLESERVRRVVEHVERTLADREAFFREHGIDSVATLRTMRREGRLDGFNGADILFVIDGWAAFRERFDALEPTIADLAARGLGHGIHVVITANRWSEVRPVVLEAIGGRLEMRMNSAIDSLIDRRRAAVIRPDQPGRGLHPTSRLFQVAVPRLDGAATLDALPAATAVAVDHIASRWSGASAPPVRLLPQHIRVDELPPAEGDVAGVPVGMLEDGLRTWHFDLRGGDPHFLVFGDGESGKTTFLRTWLTTLAATASPDEAQIVVVDYRRTLLEAVPPSHLRAYAASEPATREVIEAIGVEAAQRLPSAAVTAAQLRTRSWWTGPDLYVVVDDYDLVLSPANPLGPLVPLLAQGRDVGLHVVLARRVSGAQKAMFEPVTSRLREVSPSGLIMSGDREEGPLLGGVRATERPPGRGVLVGRRAAPALAQVAVTE